jgi:predicted permease
MPVSWTAFAQDLRYALRMLRQFPLFTAVAVGSLALGIGANTAVFTLMDAILLRWLPVQNPQELVVLARNPNRPSPSFNYPDYRYVRDRAVSYSGVIAFSGGASPTSLRVPDRGDMSQLVGMCMVSGNYFDVLGVTPATGRLFNAADNENEGAHPYVVLSHSFWRRSLGADTSVAGRQILLNGAGFQIIGVAREGFTGANVGISPDIYVPIVMYRTFRPTALRWNTRDWWWLTVMGRLKPGIARENAEAELNVLWQRILESDPNRRPVAAWDKDYRIYNTMVVLPGSQGYSFLRNQASKPLTILMITVGLVLLIACANVANLLLARCVARRREIAIRLAVGAGRGRVVAQLLTESILLGVLGGCAGLLFAWGGVKVLLGFLPRGTFPVELNLSPDLRLLGFAFAVSLASGVIFGLAPALRASRSGLVAELKSDAASQMGRLARWDLRRTLVSFQVALSLLLLAGAGLFVRTLANLRDQDPGMVRENLLFVYTNIDQRGYQPQREREFHDRLTAEAQRLPGVRAASVAAITPLGGSRWNGDVQIEGYTWKPDEPPYIDMNAVGPRYLEAAGIPIVLGRDFRDSDSVAVLPDRPAEPPAPGAKPPDLAGPPRVVIVNEAFVRRFFNGTSAIGKRLCMDDKWDPARTAEIVGVVRDARYFDLRKAVEPMIYQPRYREMGMGGGGVLCVRTVRDPNALAETIRRKIREIDPNVTLTEARSMEDNLNRNLVQERFVATLGGFFGLVALLLAAIGLYGVMSQVVIRRTREIGIRMALGAEARRVLWMVLRDAMIMAVAGAIAGVAAVLAVTRYVTALLFEVKENDPVTIVGAVLLLLAVTAVAGFLPALRATRVEPMAVLRQE